MSDRHGFLDELKRRNVWRAMVLYIGATWALAQGVAQLGPAFGMPEWGTRWFVLACVVGFPFWMAFAWFYEFTPQGLKRDHGEAADTEIRHVVTRKLDLGIIVVLTVAVALLASGYLVRREAPVAAIAQVPAKSVAVLPFENLSSDKDNAYFVAGVQGMILTRLAGIGDLKVISRTSTAAYPSHPEDLPAIARELGVASILEGTVQRAAGSVLINVQLIDARTRSHLWAESYTRNLDNMFGVEGEVAEKIARALDARLSSAEAAALAAVPTTNRAALEYYLRAEYEGRKGDVEYDPMRWKSAIPLYRKAVREDPAFALAWARLSLTESALAWFGGGGEDVAELARQAGVDAERAIELQPGLAAGQLALGYHLYQDVGDSAGGRRAFNAALKLNPNDADAMAALGYLERRAGRFDVALASLRDAVAHNPRDAFLTSELAVTYMMVGRYPEAQTWLRHALALDPDSDHAQVMLSNAVLFETRDVQRATQALHGHAPLVERARVTLLMRQRKYQQALRLLESLPDAPATLQPGRNVSKQLQMANLYRLLGDAARARPLFERELAAARKTLGQQRGVNRAFVWRNRADAELGLEHVPEGLDAIARSLAITRASGDHFYGPLLVYENAALYAQAQRPDLAAPLLAKALSSPGIGILYAPVMLWLDPAWDPIRNDPRFQALLTQYAKHEPAVLYPAAPHQGMSE